MVLRIPILYGQVENLDESAVTTLFKAVMKTSQACVMSDYEKRFPTHCDDLAVVLRQMAEKKLQVQTYKFVVLIVVLMNDRELTRWQHNRIYPQPTSLCGCMNV